MASPHNIRNDLMNHALAREPAVQRQAQQAIIAPSPRSGTRRFMRGQSVLPPANNKPSDLPTSVGSPDNEPLLIRVNTQSQSGNSPNNFVANDVDDSFVPMPRMGNASDSDDFEDLEDTIELEARNPLILDEDDINPQGECECDLDNDGKIVHNSNCHLMKEMQQLLNWNVAEEVEVNTEPHLASDVSYTII